MFFFQAVTTNLCNDYRKDIEQLEDITNRIEEKKDELEKSKVLTENDMIQWLDSINNEISKTETEKVQEVKLVVNETLMKEARDNAIKNLAPVKSDIEVTSYAPELISDMSKVLKEHYDFEENSSHI